MGIQLISILEEFDLQRVVRNNEANILLQGEYTENCDLVHIFQRECYLLIIQTFYQGSRV